MAGTYSATGVYPIREGFSVKLMIGKPADCFIKDTDKLKHQPELIMTKSDIEKVELL